MSNSVERSIIFLLINITPLFGFAQQPGQLDIQFGENGVVTIDAGGLNRDDGCNSIKQVESGNLMISVSNRTTGFPPYESDFLLAQFEPDGVLNTGFGQNGFAIADLGGGSESLVTFFADDNGDILAIGTSDQSGSYEHAILQFDSSGSLNPSFGNGGIEYNLPLGSSSTLSAAVIDSDENLVATGVTSGFNAGVLLSKYGQDGIPLNSFGTSGSISHDLGLIEATTELALQSDGKIVLAGSQAVSGNPEDALVCRLNIDGSLDDSFNSTGWINLGLSPNIDRATDISIDGDGRILVVGFTANQSETGFEMFVVRLLSNGNYDNTFGTNGVLQFDIGTGDDYAVSLILQPDGKAIIGGSSNDGNDDNFCIIRINEDGSLDPTFGNNGVVITEVGEGYDAIADMELQADGKLVVGGSAAVGANNDIALARYHTGLNTSVVEVAAETPVLVYPNPATETIMVKSESRMSSVELLDALGRSVLLHSVNANQLQLDLSKIPDGIYLLRASDGERVFTKKVVKE
jgi:uncharacterized delta-60 repeat protein